MRGFDWVEPYETYFACANCDHVYDSNFGELAYRGEFASETSLPLTCPACGTALPDWRQVKAILAAENEAAMYNTHTERDEYAMFRFVVTP